MTRQTLSTYHLFFFLLYPASFYIFTQFPPVKIVIPPVLTRTLLTQTCRNMYSLSFYVGLTNRQKQWTTRVKWFFIKILRNEPEPFPPRRDGFSEKRETTLKWISTKIFESEFEADRMLLTKSANVFHAFFTFAGGNPKSTPAHNYSELFSFQALCVDRQSISQSIS